MQATQNKRRLSRIFRAGKALRNRTVHCAMLQAHSLPLLLRRLVSRLTVNQLSDFFLLLRASTTFLRRKALFTSQEQLFHLLSPSKTHRNKAKLFFSRETASLLPSIVHGLQDSHRQAQQNDQKQALVMMKREPKLIITEKLKKRSKSSLSSKSAHGRIAGSVRGEDRTCPKETFWVLARRL